MSIESVAVAARLLNRLGRIPDRQRPQRPAGAARRPARSDHNRHGRRRRGETRRLLPRPDHGRTDAAGDRRGEKGEQRRPILREASDSAAPIAGGRAQGGGPFQQAGCRRPVPAGAADGAADRRLLLARRSRPAGSTCSPIQSHGLPKAIDKVLAVAGTVTAAQLQTALARNRRLWKEPPPEDGALGVLPPHARRPRRGRPNHLRSAARLAATRSPASRRSWSPCSRPTAR